MGPQCVDLLVDFLDFGDFFTGETGWQATLPELVFAFDFEPPGASGVGSGGERVEATVGESEWAGVG